MSIPVATIGLVGGGSNAWKVSFNTKDSSLVIGYGTMFYNGKFFSSNDIEANPIANGIGANNTIFGRGFTSAYIYLNIQNALSLPTETSDDLKIKIDIFGSFDDPNTINRNAPLLEWIPLAFIDSTGKVFDLRPSFWVNNFSILV